MRGGGGVTEPAARLAGGGARPPSWAPLRHPLFRAFWLAGLASNVGAWMQSTAGSWQMTRLSSSTLMVALMQTAANLPALLVGLPAGALADIADRRKYLIGTQLWMAGAAALLALLAAIGLLTPWTLVALTFVLALGDAADAPAWQAITPDLVPKGFLPSAVLLGGLSVNLARVLGPALAGIVVATSGPAMAYALNALSLVGVLVIVVRWRPDPPAARKSPPERIWSAVRAGVRYVRNAPAVRALYAQAAVFILFSSALWALLPVVAGSVLHLGAPGYGALLASFGAGALLGVGLSPRLRPQLGPRRSMTWAGTLVAVAMLVVAQARALPVVCVGLAAGGMGWIEVMSCLNLLTLTAVPRWVQARVLGIYWVVVQGGLAGGSLAWGILASRQGVSAALTWASIGLAAASLLGRGRQVAPPTEDLTPAPDALPKLDRAVEAESGPVLVTVEYRIDPAMRESFTRATRALERIRRRDGAYTWGLYGDLADPARYVETFLVESWAEHERQHAHLTAADRVVEDRVRPFLVGAAPPAVSHLIYVPPARRHRGEAASEVLPSGGRGLGR